MIKQLILKISRKKNYRFYFNKQILFLYLRNLSFQLFIRRMQGLSTSVNKSGTFPKILCESQTSNKLGKRKKVWQCFVALNITSTLLVTKFLIESLWTKLWFNRMIALTGGSCVLFEAGNIWLQLATDSIVHDQIKWQAL